MATSTPTTLESLDTRLTAVESYVSGGVTKFKGELPFVEANWGKMSLVFVVAVILGFIAGQLVGKVL